MADRPLVLEFGEAALLVVLGDRVDPDVNRRVHRLAADLRAAHAGDARFGRPVPAYASLLVPFDPEAVDVGVVRRLVESAMGAETGGPAEVQAGAVEAPTGAVATVRGALDGDPTRAPVEIPVRYGGSDGPDLDEVAARLDRHPDEVVALHVAPLYQVFMLGFSPGFPYLGVLPAELELPRRPEPRTRVPAGSVAIAGRQTGIYPGEIPGGWHLIGRTDLRLWDPSADPPARLAPGDRVRFVPA